MHESIPAKVHPDVRNMAINSEEQQITDFQIVP